MADQLQFRGGTSAEHDTFTGASKELTVDTDKNTVVVHDGSTAGGHPLVKESNVGTIAEQDASNVNITGGAIQGVNGSFNFDSGSAGSPSITFDGDTNTGLFRPAADTLAASTNGSERMRIDSSGNVGIGTTAPIGLFQTDEIAQGTGGNGYLQLIRSAIGTTTQSPRVALSITIPASPVFLYVKVKYAAKRQPSTNASVNRIGEYYFCIGRRGSGHNVVIDENIGNLSFEHSTSNAGGFHAGRSPNFQVQRAGSESDTAPQVVNLIAEVGSTASVGTSLVLAIEILGTVKVDGLLYN